MLAAGLGLLAGERPDQGSAATTSAGAPGADELCCVVRRPAGATQNGLANGPRLVTTVGNGSWGPEAILRVQEIHVQSLEQLDS
jgi:hypothetical protein